MRCDHKKKGGDILFFFTSLGESRSSIVSAGSLEHATSDRATMQKPARPGSETTPWLFPEKLQRDEAAFSLRLLRYSWLWIRSGEVVVFLWNRKKEAVSVGWRWSEAFLLLCCSAPECRSSACALSPLRLDQWVCLQREEGGGRERRREREGGWRLLLVQEMKWDRLCAKMRRIHRLRAQVSPANVQTVGLSW